MKKTNKILAIILAILMAISIIPITASAADATSGTCGENLTWSFDESTGTLTISGTGAMDNYTYYSPWEDIDNKIKKLVVEEGVTTIGNKAFYRYYWLVDVILPDSITTIGQLAFAYCDEITNITFGSGLETIEYAAFCDCTGLKNVELPDSLKVIGESAFHRCVKLESVTIPYGVEIIGDSAFASCKKLTGLVIPNSVTEIGADAFTCCYALTEVTIPDSVKTIGEDAFSSCRAVASVSIGSGVETIGKNAFGYCDGLTEITIPANVTTIEPGAFADCINIKEFIVDSNNPNYLNDEYGVLYSKDKTILLQYPLAQTETSYVIPDGVTTLYPSAFDRCPSLERVTIPESVTTIGEYAFSYYFCDLAIYYKGTLEQWNELLANNSDAVRTLEQYGVYCSDGTTFPSGTCGDNLIWTVNPQTRTLIISGTGPMYDYDYSDHGGSACPWRESVSEIEHIVIEDGVTKIGDYVFYDCYKVKDAVFGDALASFNTNTFKYCDEFENLTVDADNPYYSSEDGVLFNKDKTTLIYYPIGNARESYTIPDSVTTIGKYAFNNCGKSPESVIIPKSVTTIEEDAFNSDGFSNGLDVFYVGNSTGWEKISIHKDAFNVSRAIYYLEAEHQHDYEVVVTPPTCTEQGYTTYTCECDDSYVGDYVDATGHSHTSEITTPATHTATGVMTFTCTCGDTYTETIEKLADHNYETVITAPTCTEQGYTTYTCKCGDSYVADYVNKTGHEYYGGDLVTIVPTCTEGGYRYWPCSNCDHIWYFDFVDAKGHWYEETITMPTCTEPGYIFFVCKCGDSFGEALDAFGHTEEIIPAVAPTCTETGLTEGVKCSECNEIIVEQEIVPALGHTPANAVEENYVAPTCTENGSKDIVVYCSVCKEELSRETETIEATGHADNDGDGYCDGCGEQLDFIVLCDHNCHKGGISGFIWKIVNFFNKLFGLKEVCECGEAHY